MNSRTNEGGNDLHSGVGSTIEDITFTYLMCIDGKDHTVSDSAGDKREERITKMRKGLGTSHGIRSSMGKTIATKTQSEAEISVHIVVDLVLDNSVLTSSKTHNIIKNDGGKDKGAIRMTREGTMRKGSSTSNRAGETMRTIRGIIGEHTTPFAGIGLVIPTVEAETTVTGDRLTGIVHTMTGTTTGTHQTLAGDTINIMMPQAGQGGGKVRQGAALEVKQTRAVKGTTRGGRGGRGGSSGRGRRRGSDSGGGRGGSTLTGTLFRRLRGRVIIIATNEKDGMILTIAKILEKQKTNKGKGQGERQQQGELRAQLRRNKDIGEREERRRKEETEELALN